MNDIPRAKYNKAYEVAGYAGMAHKAMILYADSVRNDHEALDAASEAWHRNAADYVHVARWFPWLVANETNYEPDVYLSYILLGGLPRAKAEQLEHEVNGGEMELWQVRKAVKRLKQRKPRNPKEPSRLERMTDAGNCLYDAMAELLDRAELKGIELENYRLAFQAWRFVRDEK